MIDGAEARVPPRVERLRRKAFEVLTEEGAVAFVLKALRYPLRPLLVPLAIRSLKFQADRAASLEELVAVAKRFKSCGIAIEPWQIEEEIEPLLVLLRERSPRVVVEIGTASGGTLFLLSRVAADDALLVSIDLPGAGFGGGYPRWRAPLYRSFARRDQRVELLRADSHDPATRDRLETFLEGRPIDFLLLDGDHSYPGVRRDFEMYARLVADDGMVALHDIVPGPAALVGGVPTFWTELKVTHEATELVSDWRRGNCGLGLLRPAT